jgi:2-polyprenyl-3-methyl-5-hydroxy-6-metoxy-1,4-benzoquinol methylase
MAMDRKQHWEDVYRQKAEDTVSWFQQRPEISLALIHNTKLAKDEPLIDVGGGASRLVDHLLAEGFKDITVLDIADSALEKTRKRLGKTEAQVHWLAVDVTQWRPRQTYHLWHDRAVFHFLTEPADRAAYRHALESALAPGGTVIVANFALEGPERCSGLPVRRYSPDTLAAELGAAFRLKEQRTENHTTPAGRIQPFQYSVFEFLPERD